jgi:hypothetical protein
VAVSSLTAHSLQAKIAKWQEPPPAKQIKPLPAPDAEVKKRRGGRRLRKMKERYGLTDVRGAWRPGLGRGLGGGGWVAQPVTMYLSTMSRGGTCYSAAVHGM